MTIKVFSFSGSARKDSLNKKLAAEAAKIAEVAGLEITRIGFKDYPLPIFNEDEDAETGLPDNAIKLKEIFKSHAGWILSSPEYNGSFTPLLKNTIDWLSREHKGESGLKCFQNKTVLLLSASPGNLGALRAAGHVRMVLSQLGSLVLPQNFALSKAHEAFDADGKIKDPKTVAALTNSINGFVNLVKKLNG